MKSFSLRGRTSRSGFTLVELLVVIAIIAILASVILAAGTSAIKAAKRAKAMNTANQLQTAILGYYTEYSVYPVPSGTTTDWIVPDTDGGDWANLAEVLCGNVSPYTGAVTTATTITNTRSIAFLTLRTSDVASATTGTQDAPLNPIPPNATELYFNLAVDADYDGILGGTTSTSANKLPAFSPPTLSGTFSPNSGSGSSTAGAAVWANCTGSPTVVNSNQWVHTY
jgi:prepilin-type N-terminal cleavage/methylation domain-containing protein